MPDSEVSGKNHRNTNEDLLRKFEARTLSERVDRLEFLESLLGDQPHLALPFHTVMYFEDAKICFIYGALAATVVLCQMAAEELLRSYYRAAGQEEKSYLVGVCLIEEAFDDGIISGGQRRDFRKLNGIRNPYVHVPSSGRTKKEQRRHERAIRKWSPTDRTGDILFPTGVEKDAMEAFRVLITLQEECAFGVVEDKPHASIYLKRGE